MTVKTSALVRVTHPPRHAGVVICLDHLAQLEDVDLRQDVRHDEILAEAIAFYGHRCLMCGVEPVPDRRCENVDCQRELHPQWPAVYCCNDCALGDV